MTKVLLIWEMVPDDTNMYAFDEGSEMAELAIKSAGQFINNNAEDDDPVNELNEKLPEYKHLKINGHHCIGPFSEVVICGFVM
jgi:hypothetical protein